MAVSRWLHRVGTVLKKTLPGYCAFCLSPNPGAEGWCHECYTLLAHNTHACPRCKEPQVGALEQGVLCGHCLSNPPAFTQTTAEFLYEGAIKTLVRDFKFHASARAGTLLVELMLQRPPEQIGDALLGVPMHRLRARERGFNQAHWLAQELARRLQRPLLTGECVKALASQRTLGRRQRAANLKGAFRLPTALPEHITLVDDVVTTGATGHELARVALRAGAQRVDLWAPARTPLADS